MSGRKQDPNDKDGARGRRERVERTGASGQAHRRIVLCGEYSSTCRKVRWRKPQEGDGTKGRTETDGHKKRHAPQDAPLCFFGRRTAVRRAGPTCRR